MKKLKEQIEQFKPYNEQERADREMMLKYINTLPLEIFDVLLIF